MKHKFSVSLTLALIAVMLVTSLAVADTVKNDVIAGGTDTIYEGGTTTISYKIDQQPASQDGQAQCNAADGTPAVVSIITPSGVTATPSSLTFTNCSSWLSVSFTAGSSGDYPISASVADDNSEGGSYDTDRAEFTLHVLEPQTPTDTTPPAITPDVTGTLGYNGWYTSNVTVSWTVSDPESTVTSTSGCDPTTITTDTAGTTLTCTATSAGGTASESVTIKRDATDPEVLLVGGPADGSSHYFGFVPAAPTCTASDATSGLDGNCSVSGYGDTVGNYTVTASAFDNAGNKGTDSASYEVLAWTLTGFYRPVEMDGVWNTVKGGSTVPLKFNVFAGATELTDVGVVKSFAAVKVACEVGGDEDPVDFTTTGGTSLRYDWTDGQFIQNWKTPKSTGCYRVTMTTQDLSTIIAFFKLK